MQARTRGASPEHHRTPGIPLVIADASDAPRLVALDSVAEAAGLVVGERLADARARIGALDVRVADPGADAEALAALAHWATRYTPSVALFSGASGCDGFFLDITGAAHLLGGEDNLLADLARRLDAFGLPSKLAVAGTPGAAWAVSHFARTRRMVVPEARGIIVPEARAIIVPEARAIIVPEARGIIVPEATEAEALAPLPVEALRLAPETARALRRLGWKRIGALIGKPRAPFAARFEKELLLRLDQALGRTPEPLSLIAPPPLYMKTRSLLEPIGTEDAVIAVATRLMENLGTPLERDGKGARAVRLDLYRVDGAVQSLDLALTAPTRSPAHVARLLHLKLERLASPIEAGFGFETVRLVVTAEEPMLPAQSTLTAADESERAHRLTILLDALKQRLGPETVFGLEPLASHWPERSERRIQVRSEKRTEARSEKRTEVRSERRVQADSETSAWPPPRHTPPRPPLLFARPEPADVIALVPDGPPQRIRWRGALHTVAHAEGPERIAAEWWRTQKPQPTRDYYLVELGAGRRLWLYREGLPGRETARARWFVHGLFA